MLTLEQLPKPDNTTTLRGNTVHQWKAFGLSGYAISYTVGARYPWAMRTGAHANPNTKHLKGNKDQAIIEQKIKRWIDHKNLIKEMLKTLSD